MISDIVKIGDEVEIVISKESREWGFNPCQDGTIAVVESFGEVGYGRIYNFGTGPGVFENKYWANLLTEDGEKITLSSSMYELRNKGELERRTVEFRKNINKFECRKIRDLPETPFWEGDIVKPLRSSMAHYKSLYIIRIDYDKINNRRDDGSPYPIYSVSNKFLDSGWYMFANHEETELIERGDVWKYFHHEPIAFPSLQYEASFFKALGHYKEVRNPVTNIYRWTLGEVLSGIRDGIVHGLSVSDGFGGLPLNAPHHSAIRFDDEDLGKRVADATLRGFNK